MSPAPMAAGDAVRESQELLELFFEQSLDGFFFMMLDEPVRWSDEVDKEVVLEYVFDHQRVTRVNDAMLAQYGATRDQLIGNTPRTFFAHDVANGKRIWRRFFDAGRLHTETEERRLDGTPVHIEGDYICLYTPDRRIRGHFGIQRDITERKRTEEALRASEERFALAFRASPFRVSIGTLADGRFLEVNDTFLRDFRLTREEAIGRTAVELGLWANPADRSRFIALLERDGVVRDFEFEGVAREDGPEVTLVSAELIAFGREPCILAVAYDITERKRADEHLRRSREELRALAARLQSVREEERRRISREVHDELGQALTGLKLDLAWVADRLMAAAPEHGERVRSAAGVVDETIATVRRISTELRPGVLDHLGLVAAIEWQAAEFERRTGIAVQLDLPSSEVELDEERATSVFRILQEALTNVLRHSRARHVNITLRAEGNGVLRLEVRDDGRGITPAELAARGSLGLVGLRERAIACRGELDVRGAAGEGTVVTLRIPLASDGARGGVA